MVKSGVLRWGLRLAAVGLLAVGLPACGDDAPDEAADDTPAETTSTTEETTTTERETATTEATTTTAPTPSDVAVITMGCEKLIQIDIDSGRELAVTYVDTHGDIKGDKNQAPVNPFGDGDLTCAPGDNFRGTYDAKFRSGLGLEETGRGDRLWRYTKSGSSYTLSRVDTERDTTQTLGASGNNIHYAAFRPGTSKVVWIQSAINGSGADIYEDGTIIGHVDSFDPRGDCDALRFAPDGTVVVAAEHGGYVMDGKGCVRAEDSKVQILRNEFPNWELPPGARGTYVYALQSPLTQRVVFCTMQGGELGVWVWDRQTEPRRFFAPPSGEGGCSVVYAGKLP